MKLRHIQLGLLATSLATALSANAAIVIQGTDLANLHYSGASSQDAFYSPPTLNTPAEASLYTPDAGLNGDSPAAFIRASTVGLSSLGPLSGLSASYHLVDSSGGGGNPPYWLTYLIDPNGGYVGVISMGGPDLNASTQVHVFYDFAIAPSSTDPHWGITLGQLDSLAYGSTTFGQMTVYETGVAIGTWDIADSISASANFDTLTLNVAPVPEPTTVVAGALLLLPFGAGALRILRRRSAA